MYCIISIMYEAEYKGNFIEATLENKKTKTPKKDTTKGTAGNNKPEREIM